MDVAATALAEAGSGRVSVDEQASESIPENKFTKAIAAWRNIDLTHLIPTLDTTASDLVAHQRDALTERKELAQKTKDFRRLEDNSKLTEIKGLLKAYQQYIDLISNQNKTLSSSFLNVYSLLSEAPDPFPLLDASIESLVLADERVPQLEDETRKLQNANSKLTTQLEEAERQLENERKTRQQIEADRDSKVQEVEQSWSAVLTEKQDNWTAREKSLEERIGNQERLLKELKASYEVSQRLERGEDEKDAFGASAAELEIVQSDLERANTRLAEVESRNEQLRMELAQATTHDATKRAPLEEDPAFLRLRSENTVLMRRADSTKLEREVEKREAETSIKSLKREVTSLKEDVEASKSKLKKWSDYEDLRRELDVIKSIEFAVGDNDDAEGDHESGRAVSQRPELSASNAQSNNLEQLLLSRNKKLNNELTILRVSHQDLAGRLETLQEELSTVNMELERSKNLNVTLENDLSRMQEEAAHVAPAMSVAGYSSRYPGSHGKRGQRAASPTSSIISGFDNVRSPSANLESLRLGEPVGGGSGMMPMIIAQRDRFKKRIADLETELSKNYQTVQALRSEVGALQKDNLSLYEKSRFQSSFNLGSPTSPGGGNPNDQKIQINDTNPLERYSSAYESRMSPFAAFRGRESARMYRSMLLPERAMFQFTKWVLASRTSRNLFATYIMALHVLVLFMSFSGGGTSVSQGTSGASSSLAGQAAIAAGAGVGSE